LKIQPLKIEGPRDHEILVRIVSSGICRTDIDFIDGWDGDPVVLGHEGAGIVEVVGKDVKRVGRVIMWCSYQSCGSCTEYLKGHPSACEHFWHLHVHDRRRRR
jgi:aryl-alcohol dehydrogenase